MATKILSDSGQGQTESTISPNEPSAQGDRGRVSADQGIELAIGIMLVAYVGAQLLPLAFGAWFNVSTSSWEGGAGEIWAIIPLFALISILYYFYKKK